MTQQEWDACTDPMRLIEAVWENGMHVSHRKWRLIAVAMFRRLWQQLIYRTTRELVVGAEEYADGNIELRKLLSLRRAAGSVRMGGDAAQLAQIASQIGWTDGDIVNVDEVMAQLMTAGYYANHELAAIIKEVAEFGPTDYKFPWRTPEIMGLAEAAYLERPNTRCLKNCERRHGSNSKTYMVYDFAGPDSGWVVCPDCEGTGYFPAGRLDRARLGVLSDALEEAGCFFQTLLDHLRSPSPHVRGCWALDRVLGKRVKK